MLPDVAPTPSGTNAPLPWHVRLLAGMLRGFYFGRIRIVRAGALPAGTARLVVASHRNGAVDGHVVLAAFPRASGLISVQLLRHPVLRWMFGGIAVVREKDRARYGALRHAFTDPVTAGCARLAAGGDLVVFPEGTSAWGFRPLPYQRGAARMARRLIEAGTPFALCPLGLHYAAPDRFRSRCELVVGAPVALPPRLADETERAWELRLQAVIGTALDAVSVCCPDQAQFDKALATARVAAAQGHSLAEAFLAAQAKPSLPSVTPPCTPRWPWDGIAVASFAMWCAPVLLAAWLAGRKADARNTVTLFRMTGGLLAALLWLPCVAWLAWHWPLPFMLTLPLAALGWWRWPRFVHGEIA